MKEKTKDKLQSIGFTILLAAIAFIEYLLGI